eukprot:6195646-Pleurochrysis_carterae.AAC.1
MKRIQVRSFKYCDGDAGYACEVFAAVVFPARCNCCMQSRPCAPLRLVALFAELSAPRVPSAELAERKPHACAQDAAGLADLRIEDKLGSYMHGHTEPAAHSAEARAHAEATNARRHGRPPIKPP